VTRHTSAGSKAKGRLFQQEIREDLIREFRLNPVDLQSTAMGQAGCDIYLSQAARDVFPFGIEAKNVEALKIWEAMEQCETNAEKEGLRPLLVFRRNRTPARAVLRWADFLGIWNEVLDLRAKVEQLERDL